MNNGRIAQLGTPQELYFAPCSEFVARFLGESNLLDATVTEAGAVARLRLADGGELRAVGAEGATQGEPVRVLIRPERLRLLALGESAENAIQATVKESVFVGGVTRCSFELPNGDLLSVKQLSGDVDIPVAGAPVRLGCRAAHALVLRSPTPLP
jgi:putative spermidine/putrescine transport system ATP-binding protein